MRRRRRGRIEVVIVEVGVWRLGRMGGRSGGEVGVDVDVDGRETHLDLFVRASS